MLWLLDRAAQLTDPKKETPYPEPATYEAALKTTAFAATLLFAHGQTTERTVVAAERLGYALGLTVRVLPCWGQLTVELDGALTSQIVPAKPLGVDMGRVLAVTTVIDRVCDGNCRPRLRNPRLRWLAVCRQLPRHVSLCSQRLAQLRLASFSARSI
jgi:uncharacterized membrane protein YjjP (DUF1212 family)